MAALCIDDWFFLSFKPLLSTIQITGIRVLPVKMSSSLRNRWNKFWGVLLLILCVQGNAYNVFTRTCMLNGFVNCKKGSEGFIENLAQAMIRLTSLTCNTFIHAVLVFSIQKIITSLLEILKEANYNLILPRSVRVQTASFFGLVHLLFNVGTNPKRFVTVIVMSKVKTF